MFKFSKVFKPIGSFPHHRRWMELLKVNAGHYNGLVSYIEYT